MVAAPPVSSEDDLLRVGLFWPTSRVQIPTEYLARQNPDVVNLNFQQRVAREVEAAGFDFVLMADGYTGVSDTSRRIGHLDPTTNAILWAVPIFEATTHLCVITTMHPTVLEPVQTAAYGAALDRMSNGRWAWNITTGFRDEEAQLFGLDGMPDHRTRYKLAEESVEIALRLWSGESVEWAGELRSVSGRLPGPTPARSPHPILVNAGASDDAKRFAGRLCDYVFAGSPKYSFVGQLTEELRQLAEEFGRERPARLLMLCGAILRDDPAEALREMQTIRLAQMSDGALKQFAEKMAAGSERDPSLLVAKNGALESIEPTETELVGTPEEVGEQLVNAHRVHGLRGVMFSLPVFWPEEIRRFSRVFDVLRKADVWRPAAERSSLW